MRTEECPGVPFDAALRRAVQRSLLRRLGGPGPTAIQASTAEGLSPAGVVIAVDLLHLILAWKARPTPEASVANIRTVGPDRTPRRWWRGHGSGAGVQVAPGQSGYSQIPGGSRSGDWSPGSFQVHLLRALMSEVLPKIPIYTPP